MTEDEFWVRLEYRLCSEFPGFADNSLRFLGCDGFVPEEYSLDVSSPTIRGRVWIVDRGQELWQFTLCLWAGPVDRSAIEWSALLPPDDVTGWLSVDRTTKRLEIEPAAARPDTAT
jgi:hypothetical protein